MKNIAEKIVNFIFNGYTMAILLGSFVFAIIMAGSDKQKADEALKKEQALYCLDRAMVVATIDNIAVCVPLEVVEKIK